MKLNQKEISVLSTKIAEHYLKSGIRERDFRKLSKKEITNTFPECSSLLEIREEDYDMWLTFGNEDHWSYNYLKASVVFDMVYIQKVKGLSKIKPI